MIAGPEQPAAAATAARHRPQQSGFLSRIVDGLLSIFGRWPPHGGHGRGGPHEQAQADKLDRQSRRERNLNSGRMTDRHVIHYKFHT